MSIAATPRTREFVRDLDNALSINDADVQREAFLNLFDDYRGRNIHGQAAITPGISWKGLREGRQLTFGLVWLKTWQLDARPHQGFGEDGIVSVNARSLSGPLLGVALHEGAWRVGIAVKTLRRERLFDSYTPFQLVEIVRDDERKFSDEFVGGRGQSWDLGVQYDVENPLIWRPRLGLAVQNIGDLDFGEAGSIVQTIDAGVALHPPIRGDVVVMISVEYSDVTHDIARDDDALERTRLGVRLQTPENRHMQLAYSMGLYQGALALGLDTQFDLLQLSLATYAEEQGAFVGQDRERRYVLGFSFSFRPLASVPIK